MIKYIYHANSNRNISLFHKDVLKHVYEEQEKNSGLIRSVKDEDDADEIGEVSEIFSRKIIVFHIFEIYSGASDL